MIKIIKTFQSDSIHEYDLKVSNIKISVLIGDIALQACDAIVNAANIYLREGSGVCGAIFRGAGTELKPACDKQLLHLGRNLSPSEAVITRGYNLPAKYIIHSVSPRCMFQWNDKIEALIHKTYQTIFNLAEEEHIQSIAIPALGIGHHYCDMDHCTSIAFEELMKYLEQPNPVLKKVMFVLSDEEIYEKYIVELAKHIKRHPKE